MDPKTRRNHLHASVTAATAYGLAVGMWIGFRASDAGWLEIVLFTVAMMFAPGIVMSRIDAKFSYHD